MKKVVLLICVFAISKGWSQSLPIVINFSDKTIGKLPDNPRELKKYKTAHITVNNLPSGKYKISINKKDSTLQVGSEPALFSVLKFGDGFNSILGGLSSYAVRSIATRQVNDETFEKGVDRSPANYDGIVKKLKIKKQEYKTSDPCSLMSSSIFQVKDIQDSMRQRIFDFHFIFRDVIIKPADQLYSLLELKLPDASDTQFIRTSALNIIDNRLQLEKRLESLYKTYYDEILLHERYSAISMCGFLKAADSMLVSYKKGFNSFLTGFDTVFNEARMVKVYNTLKASTKTPFTSLPLSIKSDITAFSIDINGVDATKTPQNYSTTIELERRPNHLWAFTTGLYLSGLQKNDYSIFTNVGTNQDTTYSIVQSKGSKVEAGITALMHIGSYFNSASNMGWFGSFGPGLSLENKPRPRILLGGGIMFGRTNKVSLGAGFVGGPVRNLASAYTTKNSYVISPDKEGLINDQFKGSWYISFGYALFGK